MTYDKEEPSQVILQRRIRRRRNYPLLLRGFVSYEDKEVLEDESRNRVFILSSSTSSITVPPKFQKSMLRIGTSPKIKVKTTPFLRIATIPKIDPPRGPRCLDLLLVLVRLLVLLQRRRIRGKRKWRHHRQRSKQNTKSRQKQLEKGGLKRMKTTTSSPQNQVSQLVLLIHPRIPPLLFLVLVFLVGPYPAA